MEECGPDELRERLLTQMLEKEALSRVSHHVVPNKDNQSCSGSFFPVSSFNICQASLADFVKARTPASALVRGFLQHEHDLGVSLVMIFMTRFTNE